MPTNGVQNELCASACGDAGGAGLADGCPCATFAYCSYGDAQLACNLTYNCPTGGGRRHEGAFFASATHLATLAALERASITAFSTLRRELRAHRAPSSLLRACSRARRDEVRHARSMSALARRAGEVVPPVVVTPIATRSLEAIAIENVVEGCVRETYGALVATWQAMHAADREVATVMKRIAGEESQHAALAWRVHRWIAPRLDHAARARVAEAREAALVSLAADLAGEPEEPLRRMLGVPGARQAQAMAATLAEA
ncbi:MAG: hypothetical protein NVS3B10_03750 [Polyangiales bacterium]